jgi:hypothetical protein
MIINQNNFVFVGCHSLLSEAHFIGGKVTLRIAENLDDSDFGYTDKINYRISTAN